MLKKESKGKLKINERNTQKRQKNKSRCSS